MDQMNIVSQFNALVLSRIESYRTSHAGSFRSLDKLEFPDLPPLLWIILSADQPLQHMSFESCELFLIENFTLVKDLCQAYNSKSFWDVKNNSSILALVGQDDNMDTESGFLTSSNSGQSIKDAFKEPYKGELPQLFISTLNKYSESSMVTPARERAYNRSISIIQSSGVGKSRLVEEAANTIFTIPINIREEIPSGTHTYPPPDVDLRAYFEGHEKKSDILLQAEYTIFLGVLFDTVASMAKEIGRGLKGSNLAVAWADHLKEGQTISVVGPKRKALYKAVVRNAEEQLDNLSTVELDTKVIGLKDPATLSHLLSKMQISWKRLQSVLAPGCAYGNQNLCYVYFDEAHSLTKFPSNPDSSRRMSPYHNLGKVLSELYTAPVFFIFLSTNSHLQQFAPPPADHPSLRVSQGYALFPPFIEFPFDLFIPQVFEELRESRKCVSLDTVCSRKVMSAFGRPMWFLHHMLWLKQKKYSEQDLSSNSESTSVVPDVLTFAVDKLTAHGSVEKVPQSNLAAIGVRVGISFDSTTPLSRQAEAQHVESHMRMVYSIPEHREYMWTGSPSEPILAEAAARYLDKLSTLGIAREGPRILAENCQNGFLARGERGELCGRLLVTIAHDIAIKRNLTSSLRPPAPWMPHFHQPVPVLDFLGALFAKEHHPVILGATPVASSLPEDPDQPRTLEKAFENAFIFFSHFELAQDSGVLEAPLLQFALVRGYALQAKANQVSIDAVIPIHMGSTKDPIVPETTSAINLQFKNRKRVDNCLVNRSTTVPDHKQPVISIVFELGVESPSSPLVSAYHENHPITRNRPAPHRDDHHYTLVAYGCGPDTFNAVSEDTEGFYDAILANRTALDDFPRRNQPGSVATLETLSPARSARTRAYLALLNGKGETPEGSNE
ncbi:unnamed protein product [Rhizoctonia solani]|uniref:Uncharacterized protein n=1 Tax=Rhizoctonia solani TaxID=456999 RepID=A0A8H2WEQ3_9AGAM|nr:unnamed protein product [Rhizoctonia solani]